MFSFFDAVLLLKGGTRFVDFKTDLLFTEAIITKEVEIVK